MQKSIFEAIGITVDGANFLRAVLRLCRKLVSLGLYGTDPQLMTESTPDSLYLLTKPLVRLLQFNNDELLSADASSFSDSNTLKKSAYLRAEEQQSGAAALIATKCEILKILFLVMKIVRALPAYKRPYRFYSK